MKFLLSLLLAAFVLFLTAAIGYEGIPSAAVWRDFFTEELGFAIVAYLVFVAVSYGIIAAVASSRKKKKLAPLMARELPWRIENDNDIFALIVKFGGSISAAKGNYRQLRTFIEPNESLYFATALATLHIHGVNEPAGESVYGDLFLSDQRVFIRYRVSEESFSVPLRDIVSIALNGVAVAFCTEKINVSFEAIRSGPNAQPIFDIFASALKKAGVKVSMKAGAHTGGNPVSQPQVQTQTAIDCPGCGAVINVTVGQTSQCEYCGRFVGASE